MRALVQAVLLLVPITAGAADGPQTGVTALVGATVIDGTGRKPFRDAVVLVSGERIGAVGPRGEIVIPLKGRDVVYVTTLGVNEGYRQVFEQRFKPTDLERRLGDAQVLATLDDLADLSLWQGAFWRRWLLRWPDPRIAFWNLRRLHEAGITIAAGSDAGNIGTLHGPALHRELERMADAGLAPLAILKGPRVALAPWAADPIWALSNPENAPTYWSWTPIRRAISGMHGAFIAWSGEA